jgi:hypothetical protein
MLPLLVRGTLLFSWLNLLEIGRTSAQTRESIATFLEAVGSHWAPINLSPRTVVRRERAGILDPWRDEPSPLWESAYRIDGGDLGKVARRAEPTRSAESLKLWEETLAAEIAADLSGAREAVRKGELRLDRTNDVPALLDTQNVFGTVIQRYARGSLKIERNQIDDLLHTIVPIVHADAVFLDGPTKRELLKGLNGRAKVFCKSELDAAFEYLEKTNWA